jgi:hypothetical protein
MFIAGLIFVYNIFTTLDLFTVNLEEKFREEIIKNFPQKGIAISKEEFNKGEVKFFILGIRNDDEENQTFYVHTHCDYATKKDNSIICDIDAGINCNQFDSMVLNNPNDPIKIKSNEIVLEDIFVKVPKTTQKGTYVFYVRVCKDNPCTVEYRLPQSMTIVVK